MVMVAQFGKLTKFTGLHLKWADSTICRQQSLRKKKHSKRNYGARGKEANEREPGARLQPSWLSWTRLLPSLQPNLPSVSPACEAAAPASQNSLLPEY